MLLGRQTVIVRTKPELDQAIANTQARQIVVDGDSELLSYAEQVVNPQSENVSGGTWEFGAQRLMVLEKEATVLSEKAFGGIGLASHGKLVKVPNATPSRVTRRKVPISAVVGVLVSLIFIALDYCYGERRPPARRTPSTPMAMTTMA
jgi:hypothetical protein